MKQRLLDDTTGEKNEEKKKKGRLVNSDSVMSYTELSGLLTRHRLI